MASLCRFCRKPVEECLEADKQLITPLNPLYADLKHVYIETGLSRIFKATKYKLGCYDSKTDTFYRYNKNVSSRLISDIEYSMSKCVWSEIQYVYWHHIRDLTYLNVKELPMDEEYLKILFECFYPCTLELL